MSDVFVRGMEMPENCWNCRFALDLKHFNPECVAARAEFQDGIDLYEKRHPNWCPLINVGKPTNQFWQKFNAMSQDEKIRYLDKMGFSFQPNHKNTNKKIREKAEEKDK